MEFLIVYSIFGLWFVIYSIWANRGEEYRFTVFFTGLLLVFVFWPVIFFVIVYSKLNKLIQGEIE